MFRLDSYAWSLLFNFEFMFKALVVEFLLNSNYRFEFNPLYVPNLRFVNINPILVAM